MYEVALRSAVKAYGKENIVICSDTLDQKEDWYPTIWNITAHNLVPRLSAANIHDLATWNAFLHRIENPAHYADFMRIALVYLYGGLYADFDSIWIRPLPLGYPVVGGPSHGKTIMRIHDDQMFNPKLNKVFFTNDAAKNSNGILGGSKHNIYYQMALEYMPQVYNPKLWTSIGETLLEKIYKQCNCTDEMMDVSVMEALGIFWQQASSFFYKPFDYSIDQQWMEHLLENAYQLHLYGKMTKIAEGKVPAPGSLYTMVLDKLEITVPHNM
jgi:hypothetical protein